MCTHTQMHINLQFPEHFCASAFFCPYLSICLSLSVATFLLHLFLFNFLFSLSNSQLFCLALLFLHNNLSLSLCKILILLLLRKFSTSNPLLYRLLSTISFIPLFYPSLPIPFFISIIFHLYRSLSLFRSLHSRPFILSNIISLLFALSNSNLQFRSTLSLLHISLPLSFFYISCFFLLSLSLSLSVLPSNLSQFERHGKNNESVTTAAKKNQYVICQVKSPSVVAGMEKNCLSIRD